MDHRVSHRSQQRLILGGGVFGTLLFASQWYLYDALHAQPERWVYYLATSAYLWGVLAPLAFWFGRRQPITWRTWPQAIAFHLAVSLSLTVLQTFLEAFVGWRLHADIWHLGKALQHYFRQHLQIGLLTYWLLLAGVELYRLSETVRKRELQAAQLKAGLAAAQLRALQNQLQPHFLFNTLQAATMLIYDDPEGAEEILLALSELLRACLEALAQPEIPLGREMEFVVHYTAIQQRRFGDRLQFEFDVPAAVRSCAVPGMVLQPLVENAVRHGIGQHTGQDTILIRGFQTGEQLCLEVQNRNSRLEDETARLLLRGVGLANTIARLEQLYGSNRLLQLRNLEPKGVLVQLLIPFRQLAEAPKGRVQGVVP